MARKDRHRQSDMRNDPPDEQKVYSQSDMHCVDLSNKDMLQITRFALDRAADGVVWLDDSGRFLYVNESYCRMLGYTKEELLKKALYDVAADMTAESFADSLEDIRGEGHITLICRHIKKDGRAVPVEVSFNRVEFMGCSCSWAFIKDISERLRTQEKLEASEERFRSLVETTSDWVWETDSECRFTYCNPRVTDLLGYKPQDMLGVRINEFAPPRHRDRMEKLIDDVVKNQRSFERIRIVFAHAENGERIFECSGKPIIDENGEFAGYRGIDRDITDRVRAEDELRESEEKYRSLFNNAMVGLTRTTFANGTVLESNARAAEMLGYDDVETFKSEYRFAEHYVQDGVRKKIIDELRRSGEGRDLEAQLTRRDGSKIWIRWHARANVAEEYFDSVIIDITERKEALARLQESERIFRRLFDQSPVAIAIASPEGDYLRVNDAMCQLLGYSPEELQNMNFSQISHPEEAEQDDEWMRGFREGNAEQYERDKRFIRKDRKVIWVRTSVRAIRGDNNEVLYFIPVMQNVTDQKRAEHILESFADGIVESVPVVIVTLDLEGRIQRFNRFAEQITGYAEDEVLNKSWIDVFVPDRAVERARDHMRMMIAGHSLRNEDGVILAKDGREIFTQWFSSPMRDDEGNIAGIVGIAVDITDLRRKEEQLRQAAKMEAVGRLAGGVAHDFNNHLAAIKGYSELLLEELPMDDPAREDVLEITIAADHAAEVTKQLLAFGRKAILRPRKININEILGDTAKGLRRMLGEDITLTVHEDPALWLVQADRNQIRQILMNLALNARDAMPTGGHLRIETENVFLDADYAASHTDVTPGAYVMLTVSDTGSGMDEETLNHIFEPFYTTKQMGAGTGLGLSSVHGAVVQSGGHVTVWSEKGKGATFKIYLPKAEVEKEDRPPEAIPGECPTGDETILLVEDEGPVRRYLARTLESAGYSVVAAADPYEALKKAERFEGDVDLLITDMVMPGMNGASLADEMKKLRPGLPVLYISGYSQDTILARQVVMEAPLLTKPFTAKQLCTLVRNRLDLEESRHKELSEVEQE